MTPNTYHRFWNTAGFSPVLRTTVLGVGLYLNIISNTQLIVSIEWNRVSLHLATGFHSNALFKWRQEKTGNIFLDKQTNGHYRAGRGIYYVIGRHCSDI